jgi:hypothetical protein
VTPATAAMGAMLPTCLESRWPISGVGASAISEHVSAVQSAAEP